MVDLEPLHRGWQQWLQIYAPDFRDGGKTYRCALIAALVAETIFVGSDSLFRMVSIGTIAERSTRTADKKIIVGEAIHAAIEENFSETDFDLPSTEQISEVVLVATTRSVLERLAFFEWTQTLIIELRDVIDEGLTITSFFHAQAQKHWIRNRRPTVSNVVTTLDTIQETSVEGKTVRPSVPQLLKLAVLPEVYRLRPIEHRNVRDL